VNNYNQGRPTQNFQNQGRPTQNFQNNSLKKFEYDPKEDVVKSAEELIKELGKPPRNPHFPEQKDFDFTTSQIRKLLSAVNTLQNKIQVIKGNELDSVTTNEIKYLKVKIAYMVGRERKKLSNLVTKGQFVERIDAIKNDRTRFMQFSRFMESIVAYHKFYGGKD
jgi:CRISPR-associated protein Csm2